MSENTRHYSIVRTKILGRILLFALIVPFTGTLGQPNPITLSNTPPLGVNQPTSTGISSEWAPKAMKVQNLGGPINTSQNEYTPFVSPNGQWLFFQSNRVGGMGQSDLWYAANKAYMQPEKDGTWTLPRNMGLPVNSEDFEGMPSILFAPDGSPKELYFTSMSNTQSRPSLGKTDLYVSRFQAGKWTMPENIIAVNTPYHDRMPTVSQDGRFLFFSSDRPGGNGKSDIYKATRLPDGINWSTPINMGTTVNSGYDEFCPSLHINSHTLYFSSNRPGGYGGSDIYYSHQMGNTWNAAKHMPAPVNSKYDDEYPSVTRNGMWLYFSSDRPGGVGMFDIYRSPLPGKAMPPMYVRFEGIVIDGDPSLPYERGLNATMQILNGAKTIEQPLMSMDVVTSDSKNFSFILPAGSVYKVQITYPNYNPLSLTLNYQKVTQNGLVDRHKFILYPVGGEAKYTNLVSNNAIKVVGKVVDQNTNAPIANASVKFGFNPVSETSVLVSSSGEFSFNIVPNQMGKDLYIRTLAQGYKARFDNVPGYMLKGPEQIIIIKMESTSAGTVVTPPSSGDCMTGAALPKLKFAYGSYLLQVNTTAQLNQVVACLNKHPGYGVVVEGHTDSTGGYGYNQWLSWQRAYQAYQQLRKMGVAKNRITMQHYGYSKPIIPGAKTQAQRAQNRRVEFRLFKLGSMTIPDKFNPPPYKAKVIKKYKYKPKKKKKSNKPKDYFPQDPVTDDIEVY